MDSPKPAQSKPLTEEVQAVTVWILGGLLAVGGIGIVALALAENKPYSDKPPGPLDL